MSGKIFYRERQRYVDGAEHPRVLLEAVNGMLLFGISTAYVFAVMQVLWGRIERRRRL